MSVFQTPFKIHDENVYDPTAKSIQKSQANSVVKKGLSFMSPSVPSSSSKGLKSQLAPKSNRKALGNVSQSEINTRKTTVVLNVPGSVNKPQNTKIVNEIVFEDVQKSNESDYENSGITVDYDPYVRVQRMVAEHLKAGTRPLDDMKSPPSPVHQEVIPTYIDPAAFDALFEDSV